MHLHLIIILSLFSLGLFGQNVENKTLLSTRTSENIKIDGVLDENTWAMAPIASGFSRTEQQPEGMLSQKSVVKVLYDDKALYIGAELLDTHPDSILKELSERDRVQNADWFAVIIDTYQDGINGLSFGLTASGVQIDGKYSAGDNGTNPFNTGDPNWDAVWASKVQITERGWIVEMEIPFSALRFPKSELQSWNINFCRSIRRTREMGFWNKVDPNILSMMQQNGSLTGIKNIKAPVRLSGTPFLAGYIQNQYDRNGTPKSSWGRSFNGGMDVKYGINNAFTLDMTLIPDFGEARTDEQVLNLTAFEVQFDENRQFFTEGTELFNKGDLFYSRRIGGRPLNYYKVEDQLEDGEEIIENPITSQLYNASKISGRTTSGLGIGFFNALSAETSATIINSEGNSRAYITDPLTNYNVLVLDQNLKNNSYISLINTSVFRQGSFYDANVTGTQFEINTKDLNYGFYGEGSVSQKYFTDETDLGHAFKVGVIKKRGAINASINYKEESPNYDKNDLGFLRSPNERSVNFETNYNYRKPFLNGKLIAGGTGMYVGYNRLHTPNEFNSFGINNWAWIRTKGFLTVNMWTYFEPVNGRDYFDPRTEDFSLYFKTPRFLNSGIWFSSDYRKKFALDINGGAWLASDNGSVFRQFGFRPRYRFSNKWTVQFNFNLQDFEDFFGYADTSDDEVIYGKRDRLTFINRLNTTYSFNEKMTLSFVARHYWSKVSYDEYYSLQADGSLGATDYNEFADNSFNAFNIDCIYRWRFAPGSDIFIIWKNNIISFEDQSDAVLYEYTGALNSLKDLPINNSLSVKVIYFLDYQDFVKS